MRKIYHIRLEVEIPKELENSAYSDAQNVQDIKEVLLDEIPDIANPKIDITVEDAK